MYNKLQKAIAAEVAASLGDDPNALAEYAYPLYDKGLFGPDSVVWKVHADLPSMLIGGISSLMLQSLHPLAMAAVAQYSSYQTDPFGRLQRTARFVAGTTFGSSEMALRYIDHVKSIHTQIQGETKEKVKYSASDPHLLTFVHVAEVSSFLRAYQSFSLKPLLNAEIDTYYREISLVAEMLGAENIPKSLSEVKSYFKEIRQELSATKEAREVLSFLRDGINDFIATQSGSGQEKNDRRTGIAKISSIVKPSVRVRKILSDSAFDLLFYWAKDLFGETIAIPKVVLSPAAFSTCVLLRWAIGPSKVAKVATLRVAGTSYER